MNLQNLRILTDGCRLHLQSVLTALLHKFGDQAGPSGLVAGADARAIVTMEVFVKLD